MTRKHQGTLFEGKNPRKYWKQTHPGDGTLSLKKGNPCFLNPERGNAQNREPPHSFAPKRGTCAEGTARPDPQNGTAYVEDELRRLALLLELRDLHEDPGAGHKKKTRVALPNKSNWPDNCMCAYLRLQETPLSLTCSAS